MARQGCGRGGASCATVAPRWRPRGVAAHQKPPGKHSTQPDQIASENTRPNLAQPGSSPKNVDPTRGRTNSRRVGSLLGGGTVSRTNAVLNDDAMLIGQCEPGQKLSDCPIEEGACGDLPGV